METYGCTCFFDTWISHSLSFSLSHSLFLCLYIYIFACMHAWMRACVRACVALQSNNNQSGFSRQRRKSILSVSHSTRVSTPTTAIGDPVLYVDDSIAYMLVSRKWWAAFGQKLALKIYSTHYVHCRFSANSVCPNAAIVWQFYNIINFIF